jgi:hypothetical protein
MATFVKLNSENIVEQSISVHDNELLDNGIESEQKGINFCKSLFGQDTNWKQTSYNTHGGIHLLGGVPFRKNHAGIGYTYDESRDAFISPKKFNSWVLNENTCLWEAPVAQPNDGKIYVWNEQTLLWDLY